MRLPRFRFSLRALFAVITVLCVLIGGRESARRQHNQAFRQLHERGAVLWSWYEDPIGPNLLWTGRSYGFRPTNGFFEKQMGFGKWFAESPLCIVVADHCSMNQRYLGESDLCLLPKLLGLREVQLLGVTLTGPGLACVTRVRDLETLLIADSYISEELLLRYLAGATQLKELTLRSDNLTEASAEKLRKAILGCKVELFPFSD